MRLVRSAGPRVHVAFEERTQAQWLHDRLVSHAGRSWSATPAGRAILKSVLKRAANAATARPGPLRDFYEASLARGVRDELARVTLARKIASVALRLWKRGELWDPNKLTMQAT